MVTLAHSTAVELKPRLEAQQVEKGARLHERFSHSNFNRSFVDAPIESFAFVADGLIGQEKTKLKMLVS